uniref:MI domain-containing protein n=1 Tax=Caenorhabditis tropicalis TaxID=1561998 RepID=A0A1I7T6W4_9PELO
MKTDGLDLLLDFCDSERRKELMEDELEEDHEDDDSFENEKEKEGTHRIEEELDLSEVESDINEEGSETAMSEMFSEEDDEDVEEKQSEAEENSPDEVEDIYGRKINKSTGELIKFDPIAARRKLDELDALMPSTNEQKQRVERTVNSIINKLSDAMLIKSQQGIAELWMSNSKNDVKSALYKFLSKALLTPFRLQDSLLTTYGTFIAMCHTMISSELSAHFVECFLCDLVKSMSEEEEPDNKSMENRAVLTAFLVVFRILQPSILIEIIEEFAKILNLTNLFAIRTIVVYAYKSLKKTAWPFVIAKIDEVAMDFQMKPISALPRAKFLLEELIELKKAPPKAVDYENVERQVKVMHGITKKKGTHASSDQKELSMTLKDLLHAEERGRWWIIGSAFRLPEQGGYCHLASTIASETEKKGFPREVTNLATKAGMNSEVRRNIFCSIAISVDEDDAFEHLLKLQLKGEKERELVHVLIVMMMKEKTFNAFYAALLQRFCEYNKKFVVTLQFALWDRLRDCDQLKAFQRTSLAQLLQHLIANEVMPITVLKTVEWATRSSALTVVLKKLFIALAKSPESVLKRVFEPIVNPQKRTKYEILSEGMRVFWHMNLKNVDAYRNVEQWIMESGYD